MSAIGQQRTAHAAVAAAAASGGSGSLQHNLGAEQAWLRDQHADALSANFRRQIGSFHAPQQTVAEQQPQQHWRRMPPAAERARAAREAMRTLQIAEWKGAAPVQHTYAPRPPMPQQPQQQQPQQLAPPNFSRPGSFPAAAAASASSAAAAASSSGAYATPARHSSSMQPHSAMYPGSSTFPPSSVGAPSPCKASLQSSLPLTQAQPPAQYQSRQYELLDDDPIFSQTQANQPPQQQLWQQQQYHQQQQHQPLRRAPQSAAAPSAAAAAISEFDDVSFDDDMGMSMAPGSALAPPHAPVAASSFAAAAAAPSSGGALLPASAFARPGSMGASGGFSGGFSGGGGGSSSSFPSSSSHFGSASTPAAAAAGGGGSNLFSSVRPPTTIYQQPPQQQSASAHLPSRQPPSGAAADGSFGVGSVGAGSIVLRPKAAASATWGDSALAWAGTDFPWSQDLEQLNRDIFGNASFRTHQREAINASLAGKDTFVLMPTGAGKTLVYSLSAIVSDSLTVVFSPLIALIQDQVAGLRGSGIEVEALTSANSDWEEVKRIWKDVHEGRTRMLYVTPERFAQVASFKTHLKQLHARGKIRAFVIDEVHCLSQWGHDFRPDYLSLRELKKEFPGVVLTCLTATATESVVANVQQVLGIDRAQCVVFRQSFNRPNIIYEVRSKGAKPKKNATGNEESSSNDTLSQMADWITSHYPNQSGIIYCHSKKDCEAVSAGLKHKGLSIDFYHAGLDPQARRQVQEQWSLDRVRIIVATIAFGMGINKPDVRFVLHHTMPKSLESFYQESGRAGRDGAPAHSIVYYTYADKKHLEWMIRNGSSADENPQQKNPAVVKSNMKKLYEMVSTQHRNEVAYCENNVECRRAQTLSHFDEDFDCMQCKGGCDNCSSKVISTTRDVTVEAQGIVRIVEHMMASQSQPRINIVADIFREAKTKGVEKYRELPQYGCGRGWTVVDANRLIHLMLKEDILEEYGVASQNTQFPTDMMYLKLGGARDSLMSKSTGGMLMIVRGKSVSHSTSAAPSSARTASSFDSNANAKSSSSRSHQRVITDANSTEGAAFASTDKIARPKTSTRKKKPSPKRMKAVPKGTAAAAAAASSAAAAGGPPASNLSGSGGGSGSLNSFIGGPKTVIELSSDDETGDVEDDVEVDEEEEEVQPGAASGGASGGDLIRRFARRSPARSPAATSAAAAAASSLPAAAMSSPRLKAPAAAIVQSPDELLAASMPVLAEPELENDLFELLRSSREDIAAIRGEKPWNILSNVSMTAISRHLPCTVEQLKLMPGVGAKKAETYGVAFLPIVHAAIVKYNLAMPPAYVVPAHVWAKAGKQPPPTAATTLSSPSVAPIFRSAQKSSSGVISGGSSAMRSGYNLPLQSSSSSAAAAGSSKSSPHFQQQHGGGSAPSSVSGQKRKSSEHQQQQAQLVGLFGEDVLDDDDMIDGGSDENDKSEHNRATKPRR